jgi:Holliday junction resolvase RusA-like endonuclease
MRDSKSLSITVKGLPPTLNHDTKHSVQGGRLHSYKTQASKDFLYLVAQALVGWSVENRLACDENSILKFSLTVFSPRVLKTKTTKRKGVEVLGFNKTFGDADNRGKPAQDALFNALALAGYQLNDYQVVESKQVKEYTTAPEHSVITLEAIGSVSELQGQAND